MDVSPLPHLHPQGGGKPSATPTAGDKLAGDCGASQRTRILRAPCLRSTVGGVRSSRLAGLGRLSGSVLRGAGRRGRLPMAGEASGAGRLGGRSPGLHLAAAVLPPGRRRKVLCARSCVKARAHAPSPGCARVPALTPAPFAWASPRSRKNTNCSDQPRIGQGSVAHVLAHPLFGGHGKPSHPCVSLQHTALRTIPWSRHAFFVLKPHTTGRQP